MQEWGVRGQDILANQGVRASLIEVTSEDRMNIKERRVHREEHSRQRNRQCMVHSKHSEKAV